MYKNGNSLISFYNGRIITTDCETFETTFSTNMRYTAVASNIWARSALSMLYFMEGQNAMPIYSVPYNRTSAVHTFGDLFVIFNHESGSAMIVNPRAKTHKVRLFNKHATANYWYTNGHIVQVRPNSGMFSYYSVAEDVFHKDHVFENICYKCFHRATVVSVRHNGSVFLFDLTCQSCLFNSFCLGDIFVHDQLGSYTFVTENIAILYKRSEVQIRNVRTYSTLSLPCFTRAALVRCGELQKNVFVIILKKEVKMGSIKFMGYTPINFVRDSDTYVYIFKEVNLLAV